MRVLFATYPMAFHTPGGGEVQLLAYHKHLPAYGIDVSLFDPWNPHFLDHDIVHFFSCIGGSVNFCQFIKKLGLPLIVSASLWITHETKHLYPIDEIRSQLDLSDRVIANSDIECDTLSEVLNISREKFTTVYNGVEDFFFQTSDPELFRKHYGVEGRFILNVGNIEPRKNQLRLVEAIKSLSGIKLVLIGYPRDPEYLDQVKRMGGEKVIYLGAIPHESPLLRSAYKACTLFALPSMLETPGLAALEAAAQGAPLLVTREGSCSEYFDNNAIYIDPLSIESIKQGVRKAFDNAPINLNPNRIEKFMWMNTVKDLTKAYKELLRN